MHKTSYTPHQSPSWRGIGAGCLEAPHSHTNPPPHSQSPPNIAAFAGVVDSPLNNVRPSPSPTGHRSRPQPALHERSLATKLPSEQQPQPQPHEKTCCGKTRGPGRRRRGGSRRGCFSCGRGFLPAGGTGGLFDIVHRLLVRALREHVLLLGQIFGIKPVPEKDRRKKWRKKNCSFHK